MNITIKGLTTLMPEHFMQEGIHEVDFDGKLKIRFYREGGILKIVDAMNGYGDNCFEEVKNETAFITP